MTSLHTPHFFLRTDADTGKTRAFHNCNGGLDFMASSGPLAEDMVRLIEYAIEEGKRQRSEEIVKLLNIREGKR